MSDPVLNQPTLRKWMPICQAVGEFENGPDMKGNLSVAYLKGLIANLKKHPRQIPVYLSTTADNPDHPEDLDAKFADGWVEDLEMRGDWLYGDVKSHGQAAIAVANDWVRGASIGTVQGKAYDGKAIGSVLEHVVLTNQPFVKGMNIAAARARGGEPIAYHFTALKEVAAMADKKKPGDPVTTDPPDESLNLTQQLEAKDLLLVAANGRIQELEAANANLLEEVKSFKAAPELKLANERIRQLERHNLAEKVRRICTAMLRDGQINSEVVRAWYDHDSNEVVLEGFQHSQFKGDVKLLEFARASFVKNPGRSFVSGAPSDDGTTAFTSSEKEQLTAAGKDPAVIAKTRGAANLTDWKKRRAAAGKE